MNKTVFVITLAGLLLSTGLEARGGQMVRSEVPGELVVCFESDADQVSVNEVAARWRLETVDRGFAVQSSQTILRTARAGRAGGTHMVLIRFPREIATADLLAQLNTRDGVKWCAPNYSYIGDPRELTPNDPQYASQYHHPLMKNNLAWDITLGDPSVIIAITDDGFEVTHPDLTANFWTNAGETSGDAIDNDGNGYIDDVNGWDFILNNNNPAPNNASDTHGMHVAGIAAARTNNSVGVAGTAGGSKIMALQFYDSGNGWTSSTVALSFIYAVDNGARIINTSYNIDGWVGDPTVTTAFDYLYDQGVLHFNSAGNNGQLNPPRQAFHQTLLVVNTTSADVRSSTSNYGTGVDVCAPGTSILSTLRNNAYGTNSGTSMAAPNAAGVAALIWSAHPTWTRDQVAAQLYATCDNIDAQNPTLVGLLGGGRVNSFAAVTAVLPPPKVSQTTGLPPNGGAGSIPGGTFILRFNQIMEKTTVNSAGAFTLVHAGADDTFGTGDDASIPLSWTNYKMGTNDVVFTVGGALNIGRHRVTANAGILTNPFNTALDGDGNGTGGDSWTSTFVICQGPTPANCGSCVADGTGNGFVDGRDVPAFVACALVGSPGGAPGCGCADLNVDGIINQIDVDLMAERVVKGPRGACCNTFGVCAEKTAYDCAAESGGFQGEFTSCSGFICPQPCPCGSPVNSFPYSQNFETEALCGTTCAAVCNLVGGWTNLTDGSDETNWTSDAGGTPSTPTGPSIDANQGTAAGKYLYVEASSPCFNRTAILLSPCFDISALSNPSFEFSYHMCGTDMGSLHVEVSTDNCLSWTTAMSLVGPQQPAEASPWLTGNVDLNPYTGATALRIRLRGETGASFLGDMAVDFMRVQGN
jgi:subtilisin family serine protease